MVLDPEDKMCNGQILGGDVDLKSLSFSQTIDLDNRHALTNQLITRFFILKPISSKKATAIFTC